MPVEIIESLEKEIERLRAEVRRERKMYRDIFYPLLPATIQDKFRRDYDAMTTQICGD